MGNGPNICGNPTVMAAHNQFILDFLSQTPLFNVEDIKFPLSTNGIKIVDARGRRVKLAGGNWSGAHMCRHCVDGLQFRKMRDIAMDIRYKFKMNCIRLTYSLQLYFDNKPVPARYLTANPELIGKTSLEIFDYTVQTLTEVGLMVILNNHTSTSQWCCSNDDGDGLWWSRQFPEHMFFENAEAFAYRYKDNPRVIGSDLRNQLRKAHGLAATWGDNNPLTDWKRAAKICADKVQKIAPHWLIFVSGLDYQLDLTHVHRSPLVLNVPNKLIYTGHFYGFSWVSPQIMSWNLVSYEQFKEKLFNTQTSVRALGYPYFLGEFGDNQRNIPWKYLMQYLKETDIDWTYWALDGFKCDPNDDQTFGVFTNNFGDARHPEMLADMIEVGPPKGTKIIRPDQQTYKEKANIQLYGQPQYQQEFSRPEFRQQVIQPEGYQRNLNQQYEERPQQKLRLVQREAINPQVFSPYPPQTQQHYMNYNAGQQFRGVPPFQPNTNQYSMINPNSPPSFGQNNQNQYEMTRNTGNLQNNAVFSQNNSNGRLY